MQVFCSVLQVNGSSSTESTMCTSPGTPMGSYMFAHIATTNPITQFGAITEENHNTTKNSPNEHANIPTSTENNNHLDS